MITAICPGAYDPVTNGHIDVIKRAAQIFDRIVVGVVGNPQHKSPLFPIERVMERALISTIRGSSEGVGVAFFLAKAGEPMAMVSINTVASRVLMDARLTIRRPFVNTDLKQKSICNLQSRVCFEKRSR